MRPGRRRQSCSKQFSLDTRMFRPIFALLAVLVVAAASSLRVQDCISLKSVSVSQF